MKAQETTLTGILHTNNQFLIPLFQRYYKWKKENWEKLWEDLSETFEQHKKHFVGTVVCVIASDPQPTTLAAYQVIDGQQRLITLTLLLSVIRDLAERHSWSMLATEIEENYLTHKFRSGQQRYKRLRDRDAYLKLIDKQRPQNETQLRRAYDYYAKIVEAEMTSDEARLRAFFETVAMRLDLVMITLSKDESPYKIFRSLNSTGVDLNESDLIRNHVFMAVQLAQQDSFDDVHWQSLEKHFVNDTEVDEHTLGAFFRDCLMRSGSYVAKDGTYDAFEVKYPVNALDPEQVVRDFTAQAERYDWLRGRTPHPDPRVNAALGAIRSLNASTCYPLLLALFDAKETGAMDLDALAEACDSLASFVLRRHVCGLSSREYGRWFCGMSKGHGGQPLNMTSLRAFMKDRGWPKDDVFATAFKRFQLYQSPYALYILKALELTQQNPTEPVLLDECNIEHILPQTIIEAEDDGRQWVEMLGPEWVKVKGEWEHTPGNLTLVGHDYNSSMSNKPFPEKKPVLAQSKVYLNRYFADPAGRVCQLVEK
jgi:hypothetical protein